jgi:hypothetical protein
MNKSMNLSRKTNQRTTDSAVDFVDWNIPIYIWLIGKKHFFFLNPPVFVEWRFGIPMQKKLNDYSAFFFEKTGPECHFFNTQHFSH